MKFFVVLAIIILIIASGAFLFVNLRTTERAKTKPQISQIKETNLKASFAIFTNGTYRIFDDPKYLNQSSDVFMEKANIITVKKSGITWSEFFKTLPMSLDKDCLVTGTGQTFCSNENSKLRFFINGIENPDALDEEINEDDKLLVTFGNESESQIKLQQEQITNP
jgi:hypothetical protein